MAAISMKPGVHPGDLLPDGVYVYKIMRLSDGLFAGRGTGSRFSKTGAAWANKRSVKGHLALYKNGYYKDHYKGCVVVKCRFVITDYADAYEMTHKKEDIS